MDSALPMEVGVALRRGVGVIATVGDRLYVGISPNQAMVIRGPVAETRLWLQGIDGRSSCRDQVQSAARFGIDPGDAHRLLGQLESEGLAVRRVEPGVVPPLRRVVVVGEDDSTQVLGTQLERRGLKVGRRILPRVGPDTETALAGQERIDRLVADCRRSDLVVISMRRCLPDLGEVAIGDHLLSAEIPHVAVAIGVTTRIGPFVTPGWGGCLRCEQLAITETIPDWDQISLQWALLPPDPPEPLDCEMAAVEVAGRISSTDQSLTTDVFERHWPDGMWRQREHRRHPGCGCWWPGQTASPGPPNLDY